MISSELITNLKYPFNIPFRINLKIIIMGTSSQFHDGAQLNVTHTQLRDTIHVWIGFNKPLSQPWSSLFLFQTITETLMCNSTNFLRLTLSQYGKALSLSATPVAYKPLMLIPRFLEPQMAQPSLYLSIIKIGLSPNLYHL